MNRTYRAVFVLAAAASMIAACAVRLGGRSPVDYNAATLRAGPDESAASVASAIRAANARLVLLSAERDTAWFESVAAAAQLQLSGPGQTSGRGLAFLTSLELLGDTSLALAVEGGGQVHMHDALYRVDDDRYIDLMLVRLDASDLRAAVRALLGYIATDVGGSSAVLLALEARTAQATDSAALLMRATLADAVNCATGSDPLPAMPELRLLYGPSARATCEAARPLGTNGTFVHVQVQR